MNKEYKEIDNLFSELIDIELKLKNKAINGIKNLFKTHNIKKYNLVENDIMVALYDDGSDYHTIMCNDIHINDYDMVIVNSDNYTEHDDEDLSASVLYYLYTLLYEKLNENS